MSYPAWTGSAAAAATSKAAAQVACARIFMSVSFGGSAVECRARPGRRQSHQLSRRIPVEYGRRAGPESPPTRQRRALMGALIKASVALAVLVEIVAVVFALAKLHQAGLVFGLVFLVLVIGLNVA